MSPITIYTDGSALGNPGPGGYGAVLLSGHHRKELSQGFRLTTNNRMELMAVCVALETLKFEGSDVVIYSDSKYVVKGHAETVENNRCDCLAVAAANDKAHWLEDTGYDPAER